MAEVQTKKQPTLLDKFLKASGYSSRDVDKVDELRRVILTTNGGKYVYSRQGVLRTLSGPSYPKEVAEE